MSAFHDRVPGSIPTSSSSSHPSLRLTQTLRGNGGSLKKLDSCRSHGRPELGSWFPVLAMAIVAVWGVKQQLGALYLILSLCLSNKVK